MFSIVRASIGCCFIQICVPPCLFSPSPSLRVSASSMPELPVLHGSDGMNQHENFQQQTVANPESQCEFNRDEHRYAPTPAKPRRQHEPEAATENIAERIQD